MSSKAVATAPNEPTDHVELNPTEQAVKDAEEAQWVADQPNRDWLIEIRASDALIPRYAEDIMDVLTAGQQLSLAQETRDAHTAKKEIRGRKPL